MEVQVIFAFSLAIFFFYGVQSATFTVKNNCPYTVWPGTLTGSGPQLSTTGFELVSRASSTLNVPATWSGRFWGRTQCSNNATNGKFQCGTADCGSGKITCNGADAIPPASLIEFTLAATNNGKDFYDVSLVDGFNLPLSVTPQAGSSCNATSCSADINAACPPELQVKGSEGEGAIACKSACLAFNQPQYCCTGAYNSPAKCQPSKYSKIFKSQCPQAYSYAYDDKSSTFTCTTGANYLITFCP